MALGRTATTSSYGLLGRMVLELRGTNSCCRQAHVQNPADHWRHPCSPWWHCGAGSTSPSWLLTPPLGLALSWEPFVVGRTVYKRHYWCLLLRWYHLRSRCGGMRFSSAPSSVSHPPRAIRGHIAQTNRLFGRRTAISTTVFYEACCRVLLAWSEHWTWCIHRVLSRRPQAHCVRLWKRCTVTCCWKLTW